MMTETRTQQPALESLARSDRKVARAGLLDSILVLKDVVLPTLAKGPLIRRRKVVGFAETAGLDDKALRRMQALRRKYGPGPLVLPVPFRPQALLLAAQDVQAVLAHSPEPFAAATREKQSALNHFEPENVLASRGANRAIRRKLNEETLETGCERHSMGPLFATMIEEEMEAVCAKARAARQLDWDIFFVGWMRMVRRIVLGDAARDDAALTDLLEQLRYRANYAFLRPKARARREEMLARLARYVAEAPPESLAGRMARHCTDPAQMPHHQLPQYLFAFDPGGMASFRVLAVLACDRDLRQRVSEELAGAAGEQVPDLPLLRACLLESLRLWPTTPAILRETTRDVAWNGSSLRAGTHIMVFAPFFHRDDEHLADAHRFRPDRWIGKVSDPSMALVPFSHGPVQCPAAHFVPMVAALALRHILTRLDLRLAEPERLPLERLPGTLDNFTLRFELMPGPAA